MPLHSKESSESSIRIMRIALDYHYELVDALERILALHKHPILIENEVEKKVVSYGRAIIENIKKEE